MDTLKAEIAAKRKVLQDDTAGNLRPTKYLRRGEIERLREEKESKEREERREIKEAACQEAKAKVMKEAKVS